MIEEQGTSPAAAGEAAAGEAPARRARRYDVQLFGQWCKGCGLCIAFCPRKVFAAGADGHPVVADADACAGCQWCTEHCPDFAIVVQPREEEEMRRNAA